MAEIILVHGIDQQLKSSDMLEKDWLPALAGGIRKAGFPDIADRIWRASDRPGAIETRMAFYGDLFLVPGQQGDEPGKLTEEEADFADQLSLEWLERAAKRASKAGEKTLATRELGRIRGELGVEQGRGEIIRKAMKSLAKLRWFAPYGMGFAEKFVNRSLSQVTRYFTDERIRQTSQETVRSLVDTDTKVIIGHSLGSIVAYEAIQKLEAPLPLFMTLGSPLGLDTIVYPRLRPQPPCFPPEVRRWVNVADTDDFIASEPNLTNMFKTGIPRDAVFEGGYAVDNGAKPHSSEFYLSQIEVGRPIGHVMSTGIKASSG